MAKALTVETDDIIEQCIGTKGKWQFIVCLCMVPLRFTVAWLLLSFVYLGANAEFTCSNSTISKCSPDCPSYDYNRSVFTQTIIMEWDLVCDYSQMANVAQMIFMIGISLGSMFFGFLADRFGRRKILLFSTCVQALTGIGCAFSNNFILFVGLRFICAVCAGGNLIVNFILIVEITGKNSRTIISLLMQLPIIMGHATLPLWAYYIRNWRFLQIGITSPAIFFICYYWILPESPRWLLATGRKEEAVKLLEYAAKINHLPVERISQIINSHLEFTLPKDTGNIIDLFRTPVIRKRSFIIFVNWVVLGISFYGLSIVTTQLGDIFLNISVPILFQIPFSLMYIYFLNRFGRKPCLIFLYIVMTVCLLPMPLLKDAPIVVAVLGGIAFMASSESFSITFVFTGELFPTVIRNIATGTASMFSRAGAMVAPFISSLTVYEEWLPSVLIGILTFITAILCLFLPETNRTVLCNTIEEVEINNKKEIKLSQENKEHIEQY